MSPPQMTQRTHFFFLLTWVSCISLTSSVENVIPELSPQEYFSGLQASKASLVYFQKDVSPSSEVFLEQLENSKEALQDYGIFILKINCQRGEASSYCRGDNSMGKVYLFRDRVLVRELAIDALFSLDAIVANVLFALLFNEVKYISTLMDLQHLENSLKGQSDLAFAYVQAVGTAEHRVFMEAAFVYGSVKFALTTEVAVLKSIRSEEPEVPSSKLFFCHCKVATDPEQPCLRTLMEEPLTTLSIHKFLKLMGEPLVVEVAVDPEKISTTHLQLGLPLIFILSQEETLEADKRIAESVAWQLLGKAGVLLLSRNSVGLDVSSRFNVAIKTVEEDMPVKYLTLKDADEIVALVKNGKQSKPSLNNKAEEVYEEEEEEEEEGVENENNEQEIQDDEVVESVVRDRKRELPLEDIHTLTEESFLSILAETNHTAVLFYASWETVSLVVMQSFLEVAAQLKGTPEISLARVNCWDWPHLCLQENVTQFPIMKMYTKEGAWLAYSGMWETKEMMKFIELSRNSCPVRLMTPEEVEEYLSDKTSPHNTVSVLGIFDSSMSEAREAFIEAGRILNGYVTTGIYYEEDAIILSHKYNVPLPALLFAKPATQQRNAFQLSQYNTQDIVKVIRHALLETFPEITVENLPDYFQIKKPLLILFSDGVPGEREVEEMKHVAVGEDHKTFIACWLNLKNTPVGRNILKAYFGNLVLPMPLLLWINLHSRGHVFVFPSDQSVSETNILAWIEKLKTKQETPRATLSEKEWKPRLPAYDFLSMMEPTLPEFTIYTQESISIRQEEILGETKAEAAVAKKPTKDSTMEELKPTGRALRRTAPHLGAKEKQPKHHSEL
ncbi:thioredoxin domain-containing protein 16 [Pantherophis guttatus]|uniref:Thioredoxin domain-containing protein 16 n=1 Tax=Pantherophis guttatus TaxID=94885 RepID=A0A6P9DAR0_PANGU|nr:thioredoxin domain-containing protein 16 [Pantherophis guttatus]XP_034289277.1 thioredoxin domain-containing protein 16 [Pantherophis guttatus]